MTETKTVTATTHKLVYDALHASLAGWKAELERVVEYKDEASAAYTDWARREATLRENIAAMEDFVSGLTLGIAADPERTTPELESDSYA
jgi:hypothetical protein